MLSMMNGKYGTVGESNNVIHGKNQRGQNK